MPFLVRDSVMPVFGGVWGKLRCSRKAGLASAAALVLVGLSGCA
ncbi:MAG: hypothetical protein V4555_15575 [Acidobacteriota bacterium]